MPFDLVGQAHFGALPLQPVAHNVAPTPLQFDNNSVGGACDTLGIFDSNVALNTTNHIVVPDGYGITHVQASGMIFFETATYVNAVGMIRFNGNPGIGQWHFSVPGLYGTIGGAPGWIAFHPVISLTTPYLPVLAGDEIQLVAVQTNYDGAINPNSPQAVRNVLGNGLTTALCVDFLRKS